MKKEIIAGCFFAALLLVIAPNISAIEYNQVEETQKTTINEQIPKLMEKINKADFKKRLSYLKSSLKNIIIGELTEKITSSLKSFNDGLKNKGFLINITIWEVIRAYFSEYGFEFFLCIILFFCPLIPITQGMAVYRIVNSFVKFYTKYPEYKSILLKNYFTRVWFIDDLLNSIPIIGNILYALWNNVLELFYFWVWFLLLSLLPLTFLVSIIVIILYIIGFILIEVLPRIPSIPSLQNREIT